VKNFTLDDIGNYYGCLNVEVINGRYYWSIENYDGDNFEEIPESLYNELLKHYESLQQRLNEK